MSKYVVSRLGLTGRAEAAWESLSKQEEQNVHLFCALSGGLS